MSIFGTPSGSFSQQTAGQSILHRPSPRSALLVRKRLTTGSPRPRIASSEKNFYICRKASIINDSNWIQKPKKKGGGGSSRGRAAAAGWDTWRRLVAEKAQTTPGVHTGQKTGTSTGKNRNNCRNSSLVGTRDSRLSVHKPNSSRAQGWHF